MNGFVVEAAFDLELLLLPNPNKQHTSSPYTALLSQPIICIDNL